MTTYVTVFSRALTSYSYMIGAIIQKLFSRTCISYTNHHCGPDLPDDPPWTNHCESRIGGGYRGHY